MLDCPIACSAASRLSAGTAANTRAAMPGSPESAAICIAMPAACGPWPSASSLPAKLLAEALHRRRAAARGEEVAHLFPLLVQQRGRALGQRRDLQEALGLALVDAPAGIGLGEAVGDRGIAGVVGAAFVVHAIEDVQFHPRLHRAVVLAQQLLHQARARIGVELGHLLAEADHAAVVVVSDQEAIAGTENVRGRFLDLVVARVLSAAIATAVRQAIGGHVRMRAVRQLRRGGVRGGQGVGIRPGDDLGIEFGQDARRAGAVEFHVHDALRSAVSTRP